MDDMNDITVSTEPPLAENIAASKALWTYHHAFSFAALDGAQEVHEGLVEIRSTMKGMASKLMLDGHVIAQDATPAAGKQSSATLHIA